MPSLPAKDRVSLCLFTYEDSRRCRTPRISSHPHFCFYHAQKEAQARAAGSLAKDLATFFSGDYLSACDLSAAMARLIPAVIRVDIKPRLARTVAYMFQTQLQAIHLSQHEYINTFGTDGWRKAVRTSVNVNYDYRFPPDPDNAKPEPQQPKSTQSQPANSHLQQPATSSPQTPSRPHSGVPAKPQPPSAASPAPAQTGQPKSPAPGAPPRPQAQPTTPNHDPHAVHFDHNHQLRESPNLP